MADRLRLEVELELADPITGRLVADGGPERRFTGWLELHAALDAACVDAARARPAWIQAPPVWTNPRA
jgi:hypothetical protein